MIRDVGTDLCSVSRVQLAVDRTGERFLRRVFTPAEREAARLSARPAAELARSFAVKESVFKVLGRGWPNGIGFDEIELRAGRSGAPASVLLRGRAAEHARRQGVGRWHVAVDDDGELAVAVVVAET